MVTTRRQSGNISAKGAAPNYADSSSDDDDDREEYEFPETVTNIEETEEDEYKGRDNGNTVSKRRKTQAATAGKKGTKTAKKLTDIGRIMEMPLDVLFEIFGRLEPKDLLHLSRSNKMLRKTLLSKQAITIWKAVLAERNAPDCPSDYSEPQWANLLFGGTSCQSCGAKGIPRVDFGIRRRACVNCKKANFLTNAKFKARFPDYDPLILQLILYTNKGGWSHGHASNSKFYWLDDVTEMCQQLGVYTKDVSLRKRGAKKALDDFIALRMELVEQSAAEAKKYSDWSLANAHSAQSEKQAIRAKRLKDIIDRLMALGHDAKDTDSLWQVSGVDRDTELTDNSWSRIRKSIEEHVNEQKALRIIREREPIIRERKSVVRKVYKEYKTDLVPLTWASYPNFDVAYQLECFATLIEDPSDSPLDIHQCRKALEHLPEQVEALNGEKKAALLALLGEQIQQNRIINDEVEDGQLEGSTTPHLDLATSLFSCCPPIYRQTYPIFSWQDAIYHSCPPKNMNIWRLQDIKPAMIPQYQLATKAFKVVQKLAVLLHLDPGNATPSDFDKLDARFTCKTCPESRWLGYSGRSAMSWLECARHAETQNHEAYELLLPSDSADVKAREGAISDPAVLTNNWICNLCPKHLDDAQLQVVVLQHLKEDHGKTEPVEGVDFFYNRHAPPRPPRTQVHFGTLLPTQKLGQKLGKGPSKDHKCKHCGGKRLFDIIGVKAHIKAVHKVNAAQLGVDFEKP